MIARKRPPALQRLVGVITIIALAAIAAGCGGSGSTTSAAPPETVAPSATTPAPVGQSGELHLFSVNAATGQSAAFGLSAIQMEQLFVDNTNAAGGLKDDCGNSYTLKLTVHDMANSREQAIAGIRTAAGDSSVGAVLGPVPDVGNVPMVPVAGELKIPYVIPSWGSTISDWNPYSYRVGTDALSVVPTVLQTLQSAVGVTNIAQIYDQTQDQQKSEADAVQAQAQSMNIPVVAFEAFNAGDVDFRPQLTGIQNKNPDWIWINAAPPEAIAIVNQMAELQFKPKTFISVGVALFPNVWDATEGKVTGTYTGEPGALGPGIQYNAPEAIQQYRDKYGEDPKLEGTFGWDAAAAVAEAVKRACSSTDREAIRGALQNLSDFPLAAGGSLNWKNPPSGDNQTPNVIAKLVTGKGEWQLVEP